MRWNAVVVTSIALNNLYRKKATSPGVLIVFVQEILIATMILYVHGSAI